MIWFTSDWHAFSDERVSSTFSPFSSGTEMTEVLIANVNSLLKPDDVLYIVGDFVNYTAIDTESWRDGLAVAKQLNCRVELLLGNNEKRLICDQKLTIQRFQHLCRKNNIRNVREYKLIRRSNGKMLFVAHKPIDCMANTLCAFGHIHTLGPITGLGYNVCCFCNHFRPVSLEQIEQACALVKEYFGHERSARKLVSTDWKNWSR